MCAALLRRGLLIRGGAKFGLPGFARVTIAREKEKISTSNPGASVPAAIRSGRSPAAACRACSTVGTTRTLHPSAPRAALIRST